MAVTDKSPKPYRELTVAAVVLGVLIGAMMTAAFIYIALKLGFTLPGSTVAALGLRDSARHHGSRIDH
ncbi:MAG: hypothetical protein O3B72_07440 [Proteobacteria bacterium]|nr:hypothetical protein [Pseudomonadota bacterium]